MRDYHYGVYIGRFQPLHVGHETIIREALERVETLIIVVGSSFVSRTPVNPFSFTEREQMLRMVFGHEIASGRIIILPLYDYEHDHAWISNLKSVVNEAILDHANQGGVRLHGTRDFKVALTGYGKDASSYYLKMFPNWDSIQIETQHGTINASDIRYDYLRRLPRYPSHAVNPRVNLWLEGFSLSEEFKHLVAEKQQLQDDKVAFGAGPFLTADALVTWRGKVLLVTRGGKIGYGLFAMPGGFVNPGERMFDAALRELQEETKIEGVNIDDFYAGHMLADNPKRSLRGRVVSMVFHFDIPSDVEVQKPEGSDDARHADWYSFEELNTSQFFDDHHTLISNMLKDAA
jgi:bifunctional NMN adenylyltransferase/nudix hydrolase